MDEVTLDFMDRIPKLRNGKGEMPDDFQHEIYKFALESVGLVALNRRLGCFENNKDALHLINTVNDVFKYAHKTENGLRMWQIIPFMPAMMKLKKANEVLIEIADKHIQKTYEDLMSRSSKE